MRLMVDSLIAVMLAAVLAGVFIHFKDERRESVRHDMVRRALATLHEQTVTQAGLDPETGSYEFPTYIAPKWFQFAVPVNVLVQGRHAWIDVAPPGDYHDHPPDPILTHGRQAGFWYNPERGVFRARIPRQTTDQRTLEVYNAINGAGLKAIPTNIDPKRQPIAMTAPPDETTVSKPSDPSASENRSTRKVSTSQ